eukprot:6860389-Pyramimonas_sp.AAC.1
MGQTAQLLSCRTRNELLLATRSCRGSCIASAAVANQISIATNRIDNYANGVPHIKRLTVSWDPLS